MSDSSFVIPLLFNLTFIVTIYLFFLATNKNWKALLILVIITAVQSILAFNGFYLKEDTIPPRLALVLLPSILLIIIAFLTPGGRRFIDQIDSKKYTYLHIIRIPVEIVLLLLFMDSLIPESMTFEGRNFDIFSGLTAPLIAYFGFQREKLSRKLIIAWNILCLLLVLQVVITGVLSVPTQFQQLSFDQPNVAVLYFPYVLLPAIIVPIVIFGHLAVIKKQLS